MKRNYIGSKAIDSVITLLAFVASACIVLGAIVLFIAIMDHHVWDWILPSIGIALISVPVLIIRAILRGFESMVIASEMYIEQMEIEHDKCAKNVHKEIDTILND